MCLGAIFWARISKVVFAATKGDASAIGGFDDDHFYEEINAPWEKRIIAHEEIMRAEGQKLFEEWKQNSDRIMY